jgi:transposase InsO family protein
MKHDFPKVSKKKLCELFGKSRGAIYDHQKRVKETAFDEDVVLKYVKELRVSRNVRDTRKLHLDLKEPLETHGIRIGRDHLFDLLRSHKMLTRRRKRRVVTTDSRHWMRKYSNLITGLEVMRPEQVWVSDITYISMNGRWGYLSLITDVYSRKIMGYYLRTDLSAQGCIAALQMAISNRQYPHEQLIHHSDRGSQYCSAGYVKELNSNHISISMTENGSPYENAIAERVNGTIKGEFNLHQSRLNYEGTCELVARSIKIYNEQRRHASCDYLTPQQAHQMQGPLKRRWKNYPRKAVTLQQELRE